LEQNELRLTARERYRPVVVGRREELAELWELTLKGRHVILAGEPGIGKSVLLEMLYEGLRSRGDLHVFRVSEERQFKNALLELARCMHERGIFRHPRLSEMVVRSMSWEKLASRVRALTVKELAETLVIGLTGRKAVLLWDQVDGATPTVVSWLHQFLSVATMVVATPSRPPRV
jgi:MoxR-like ATPase